MTRKPRARRGARVSPLVAGTVLAAVLVVPSAADAQGTPTGNGKLYYGYGSGQARSVWANGTHVRNEPDLPVGTLGSFNGTGDVLSFVGPGSQGRFANVTSDVDDTLVTDPEGRSLNGLVASPNGAQWLVATPQGVFRVTPNGSEPVWDAGIAGRIEWSSENGIGTVVWDGQGLHDDGGGTGIPGGDPDIAGDLPTGLPSQETAGHGIFLWTPGGGAPVEVVTDATATNPSISQDGRIVAYEADPGTGRGTDIFYIDRSESNPVPHLLGASTGDNDQIPAVSPDGTQIAFLKRGSGRIVRAATTTTTGSPTTVGQDDAVNGVAWQPADVVVAGSVGIDGTAKVGQTLTATMGTGSSGAGPIEEQIVWESCDDLPADGPDPSCTVVASNSATYTVQASDAGKRLRAVRVATNPTGENRSYSQRTSVVPTPPPADTTAPEAPTFTTDVPGPVVDYSYPSFAWTAAEDGGTFECRVVPAAPPELGYDWAPCASPVKQSEPLGSGEWVFEVRQIDAANNPGEVARHRFTVDLDRPVPPTLVTSPEKTTTSTSATFTFSNPSNEVTTFECLLDPPLDDVSVRTAGPEWKPCTSPHVVDDLSVGQHELWIRQVDRAGNHSSRVVVKWTVEETPVVVPPTQPEDPTPVPETPVKVEQPVVETPKAEAPKVETPAPAPKAEAPKPAAPAKRPALTAVIGGTKSGAQAPADGGASSATIKVAKESVGVGCTITGTVLKSCKVDLYATVAVRPGRATSRAAGTSAHASATTRQVLVGTGTYEQSGGSAKMNVRVELNATGKALLRTSPGGLKVAVKITGRPVSGAPLKATGAARLVSGRAALTVGGFAVNSAQLTPAARKQLRVLAAFGKATTVRCVGHTDASSDDTGYLQTLGARRAQAVCAFLAGHGVRGARTLVSKGSKVPVATNTTQAGRAKNRRVQVTLVR